MKIETTRDNEWPKSMLYAVAALSLLAALIHFWVMPEHFGEWWGYGISFLIAASAQLLYVPLLLRRPSRTIRLALVTYTGGGDTSLRAWEVEKVG